MQTKKISFGKPAVVDTVELGQTDMESLINGYQDEFKCYVKRQGVTTLTTLGTIAPVDGLYRTINHYVIGVANGILYNIDQYGTLQPWTGTQLTPGNLVVFAEDMSKVFAAHGGKLTMLDPLNRIASHITGNAPTSGVTHVVFKDRYLLCNGNDNLAGDQFYSDDSVNAYSRNNSWEVFNNEENADALTAVHCKWGETLSMGPESIEWVEDDGVTPWAKMNVPPPGVGLLAPYSVVDLGTTFYFLSVHDRAPRVVRIENRQVRPISYPIDPLISTASAPNARAWGITMNNIPFYVLYFPSTGMMLAYNSLQDSWSNFVGFPCNSTVFVKEWNKTLIGDNAASGKVYTLGGLTDDGDPIVFQLTSGNIDWGTNRLKRSVKLVFTVKRGQATDISETFFDVQFKDDGGPWSPPRRVSLGFAEDTNYYGVLYQCGIYRRRQIRITHDDPKTDFILAGVEETFDVLNN